MTQNSSTASTLATLSEVPGTELRQLQATFQSFREFVGRYSPWLSDSCIFVETLEPVPVGAPVRLEIRLEGQPLLIRALGQVDWVRKPGAEEEDGPPGVALNISYLDSASSRLIDSIFRLYSGQQSATMGEEVAQTWEVDVESLIDDAFPGGDAAQPAQPASPPPAPPAALEESPEMELESGELELEAEPEEAPSPAAVEPEPMGEAAVPVEPEVAPPEIAPPEVAHEIELESVELEVEPDEPEPAEIAARDPVEPEPAAPGVSEPPVPEVSEPPVPEPPAVEPPAEVPSFGFGLVEPPAAEEVEAPPERPAAAPPEPPAEVAPPPREELPPAADASAPETAPAAPIYRPERGAAVAAGSGRSFWHRFTLFALLAVVAAGLVFAVFRLRAPEPGGAPAVAEIAEATAGEAPSSVEPGAVAPDPETAAPEATEPSEASAPPEVTPPPEAAPPPEATEPVAPPTVEPAAAEPAVPEPVVESGQTATAPSAIESGAAEPGVAEPGAAEPPPATLVEDVERLIKTWAAAWSAQLPDDYLACYAPDYSPPGLGRRAWEDQRRVRLQAPSSIRVRANDLSVKVLDESSAVVTFHQEYQTDTKHLFTWKTMEVSRLPEGWKIVSERAGR